MAARPPAYSSGQEFNVERYPFVRCKAQVLGDEGIEDVDGWRPGTLHNEHGPLAEGLGVMHVRVVGVFKPGKYPARIFYERAWTDPDGKRFGARKLQIATSAAFTRLLRGYRHNFSLEGQ